MNGKREQLQSIRDSAVRRLCQPNGEDSAEAIVQDAILAALAAVLEAEPTEGMCDVLRDAIPRDKLIMSTRHYLKEAIKASNAELLRSVQEK